MGNEENSGSKGSPKKSKNSEVDFVKLIDSKEDAIKKNAGDTDPEAANFDDSDSESDILVIDMKEDPEERKASTENGVKKDFAVRPAKRRRASSSKSDSKEGIIDAKN